MRPMAAPMLDREILDQEYRRIRRATAALCEPLSPEHCAAQSMPDASPSKWHLAHTSWFFETFVLGPFAAGYTPLDARYAVLFNSYYQGVGPQFSRPSRGLLTRPSLAEVMAYRARVDEAVGALVARATDAVLREAAP